MTEEEKKPADRWEMAITLLAGGCSKKRTCELTHIGGTQLAARLKTKSFCDRIEAHKREICSQAAAILAAASVKAAEKLVGLVESKSENMQFKASMAILESAKTQKEIAEAVEQQTAQGTLLRPDDDARAMDATIPKEED
jgi:hypothetical protein